MCDRKMFLPTIFQPCANIDLRPERVIVYIDCTIELTPYINSQVRVGESDAGAWVSFSSGAGGVSREGRLQSHATFMARAYRNWGRAMGCYLQPVCLHWKAVYAAT